MKHSRSTLSAVGMFLLIGMSFASRAEISDLLKAENLVGRAKMEYLWWDVYDIRLFAAGVSYHPDKVFALELTYLMPFSSEQIAKRSIKEIRKLGFKNSDTLDDWKDWLTHSLPNVREGESLLGIKTKNDETLFYKDNTFVALMDDAEFTRYFFSIWLHEKTSEPGLRKQLLGADYNE